MCQISGYCGMPTLKLRPKSMSMHGRQYVQVGGGGRGWVGRGQGDGCMKAQVRLAGMCRWARKGGQGKVCAVCVGGGG